MKLYFILTVYFVYRNTTLEVDKAEQDIVVLPFRKHTANSRHYLLNFRNIQQRGEHITHMIR